MSKGTRKHDCTVNRLEGPNTNMPILLPLRQSRHLEVYRRQVMDHVIPHVCADIPVSRKQIQADDIQRRGLQRRIEHLMYRKWRHLGQMGQMGVDPVGDKPQHRPPSTIVCYVFSPAAEAYRQRAKYQRIAGLETESDVETDQGVYVHGLAAR